MTRSRPHHPSFRPKPPRSKPSFPRLRSPSCPSHRRRAVTFKLSTLLILGRERRSGAELDRRQPRSRLVGQCQRHVSYNTNTTRIDGAVNDYGWLPYLLAYLPPADSIQSVNVVTNSFTAETRSCRRRLHRHHAEEVVQTTTTVVCGSTTRTPNSNARGLYPNPNSPHKTL